MRKIGLLFLLIFFLSIILRAQKPISVGSTPSAITFSSFDGSGFAPTPSAGQLDSDEWRIDGLSDGNSTWEGSYTTGDFARGLSSGGVTTGGIYAFDIGSGNIALGFQAGSADLTPGKIILRLINTGSDPITQLDVSYKILDYNDQDRANSINFSYGEGSTEPGTFTAISALDFTTTEVASPSPAWNTTNRSTTITGLSVAQNQFIYLVWETDDISGSGSRDEIAIDNIAFFNILPVELTSFSASVIGNAVKLIWKTATEVNNYGFDILRQAHTSTSLSMTGWEKIGFVSGNGNSNSPKSYSFTDRDVNSGKYSYRLKQIDNDGTFEYSKKVEADLGAPTKFELGQNYPNPFNPTTTISYDLPEAANVKLTIFNILGQEIATLVDGFKEAGNHTLNFDADNLDSGLYIYKLQAGSQVQTKKMTLIK